MSILKDRAKRNEVAAIQERFARSAEPALAQMAQGIAKRDGKMQHYTGIAVAIGNTGGAAIAD